MDKEQAYNLLVGVVSTPQQKEALDLLYGSALVADQASSKQVKFLVNLAGAHGTTLQQELDARNIAYRDNDPRTIHKNDAKNLISEFIKLGYQDELNAQPRY